MVAVQTWVCARLDRVTAGRKRPELFQRRDDLQIKCVRNRNGFGGEMLKKYGYSIPSKGGVVGLKVPSRSKAIRNVIRGISHYSLSKIEFQSRPSLIGWNTSKLRVCSHSLERGTGHGLTLARLVFRLRWGAKALVEKVRPRVPSHIHSACAPKSEQQNSGN